MQDAFRRHGNQPAWVKEQYRDAGNLNARIALHQRFGTATRPWLLWVFDRFAFDRGARILEIGAGPGGLWAENRHRLAPDWRLVLTDLSPGMVAQARQTLAGLTQIQYALVDAQALSFAPASFDGVIANHMLYHVPDQEVALAEIRRALKPQGRFFAATNGENHMHQLVALGQRFLKLIQASNEQARSRLFTFEEGRQKLAAHFDHVVLHRYENELHVTDPEALSAYMLSGAPATVTPAQVEQLRAFVKAELARHCPFIINNDTGLFEATVSAA